MPLRILDELSKTAITLLLREPFYAHLLAGLHKEVVGKGHPVETMAVGLGSGKTLTLYINGDFWDTQLTNPEHRAGVLKHEMLHLVFRHLMIDDPKLDSLLMNIAFDLVVNQYVSRNQLPDDSIFLDSFPELILLPGQTWYYYYQKIEALRRGGGADSGNTPASDLMSQIRSNSHGMERHQPWREIKTRSESENSVLDIHLDSLMRTAHQRTSSAAWGNMSSDLREILGQVIHRSERAVNWQGALRLFSQSTRSTRLHNTIRRPSKRYGTTPGIQLQRRQRLLVAIDASGSIGKPEFDVFFSELRHLWRTGAYLEIVECDTAIKRRYTYKGQAITDIVGRGGTDFNAPVELANQERFDGLVYFTDGFADKLRVQPRVPVLWLISPKGLEVSSDGWNVLPGRKVKMG